MAVPTGFEPATSGLTGRRALQTAPRDQHPLGGRSKLAPAPRGTAKRDRLGTVDVPEPYAPNTPGFRHELAENLARAGELTTAAEGLCVHQAMINHDLGQDTALELIRRYLSAPPDPPGPLRAG